MLCSPDRTHNPIFEFCFDFSFFVQTVERKDYHCPLIYFQNRFRSLLLQVFMFFFISRHALCGCHLEYMYPDYSLRQCFSCILIVGCTCLLTTLWSLSVFWKGMMILYMTWIMCLNLCTFHNPHQPLPPIHTNPTYPYMC